jgi:hypothetical protein
MRGRDPKLINGFASCEESRRRTQFDPPCSLWDRCSHSSKTVRMTSFRRPRRTCFSGGTPEACPFNKWDTCAREQRSSAAISSIVSTLRSDVRIMNWCDYRNARNAQSTENKRLMSQQRRCDKTIGTTTEVVPEHGRAAQISADNPENNATPTRERGPRVARGRERVHVANLPGLSTARSRPSLPQSGRL